MSSTEINNGSLKDLPTQLSKIKELKPKIDELIALSCQYPFEENNFNLSDDIKRKLTDIFTTIVKTFFNKDLQRAPLKIEMMVKLMAKFRELRSIFLLKLEDSMKKRIYDAVEEWIKENEEEVTFYEVVVNQLLLFYERGDLSEENIKEKIKECFEEASRQAKLLDSAISEGNAALVENLLEKAPSLINYQTENSRFTPLMRAAKHGDKYLVKYLVDLGPNLTLRNEERNNIVIVAGMKSEGEDKTTRKWIKEFLEEKYNNDGSKENLDTKLAIELANSDGVNCAKAFLLKRLHLENLYLEDIDNNAIVELIGEPQPTQENIALFLRAAFRNELIKTAAVFLRNHVDTDQTVNDLYNRYSRIVIEDAFSRGDSRLIKLLSAKTSIALFDDLLENAYNDNLYEYFFRQVLSSWDTKPAQIQCLQELNQSEDSEILLKSNKKILLSYMRNIDDIKKILNIVFSPKELITHTSSEHNESFYERVLKEEWTKEEGCPENKSKLIELLESIINDEEFVTSVRGKVVREVAPQIRGTLLSVSVLNRPITVKSSELPSTTGNTSDVSPTSQV